MVKACDDGDITLTVDILVRSSPDSEPLETITECGLQYEFYDDALYRGQYTFHIRNLDAKNGSIIHINPHKLHVSDAETPT